jgi:hypothetical protein
MTAPDYLALFAELAALPPGDPAAPALIDRLHAAYLVTPRGGTTGGGLPYPSPTDPVAAGADAIRALAEAVDPYVADTGWADLTLKNGWTAATGNRSPQFRRIGKVVYLRGRAVGAASTSTTLATLPVGFIPGQVGRWSVLSAGGGTALAVANVSTTGDITATQAAEPNLDPIAFAIV